MNYLINPSERDILDDAGDRMPIGLYSIASNNPDTRVYDLNHDSEDIMMEDFYREKPERVGISAYTSALHHEVIRLADQFDKKRTTLVAGGHHATALPHALEPYFHLVVRGEGEEVFNFPGEGVLDANPPDLKELEFSYPDLSNYGINQSGKRTGTIITSRGCPYSCSFCGKLSDKVRFEPISKVKKQIDDLVNAEFEAIYFVDDVFTLKRKRMEEIAEYTKVPFRVTTRANLVDEERLDVLAKEGCEWISFGIESGSDKILKQANKGLTTAQNWKAVNEASKRGIKTKGFFIIGLPGETEETARQTIDYAANLAFYGLDEADFYYLTPFPGTPIWKNPEKFGIDIVSRDYSTYLQAGKKARCVVNTKGLKAGRIEELVREANEQWNQDR